MSEIAPNFTLHERVACACIAGIIFGLILPKVLSKSGDQAVVLWMIFSMFYGLLLGSPEGISVRKIVKASLFPAAFGPFVFIMFYFIENSIKWMQTGNIPTISMRYDYPGPPITFNSKGQVFLLALIFIFCFIATTIVSVLTAISKRVIIFGASHLFRFGPEGLDRVNKLLVALGGVVAVIFSLWISL